MRITSRQLRRVIREELIREARQMRPEVQEMQKLLGMPDAEQDGVWGGKTEKAWDKFVANNYKQPTPDYPSVSDVQSDWEDAGPKLGYPGDHVGALRFVKAILGLSITTTPATTAASPPASGPPSKSASAQPAAPAPDAGDEPFMFRYNDDNIVRWNMRWNAEDSQGGHLYKSFTMTPDQFNKKFVDDVIVWVQEYDDQIMTIEDVYDDGGPLKVSSDPASIEKFKDFVDYGRFDQTPMQESLTQRWGRLAGILRG